MKPSNLFRVLLTIVVFNLFLSTLLAFLAASVDVHVDTLSVFQVTTSLSVLFTALKTMGMPLHFGIGVFTVTDLTTAWGAYYVDGGQNERDLIVQLFHGTAIDELFTIHNTENTQLRKAQITVTGGPQPFQLAFTPKGGLSVKPLPIPLFHIKDDRELYPHEVQQSWIGFMGPKNGETELTCPLPKYITDNYYLPNHVEGMCLNEVYAGEYAAPTPGTAGPDGTSMDGIALVLNNHIDAGRITPISSGAWSTDPETFVEQIEAWYNQVDLKSRKKKHVIAMNTDLELRYRIGKARLYNSNHMQVPEADLLSIRHFSNASVKGYVEMGSSQKIFTSVMENSAVGVKRGEHRSRFQFEQQDRKIKMWTDYYKGYGWWDYSRVFTNDLELLP